MRRPSTLRRLRRALSLSLALSLAATADATTATSPAAPMAPVAGLTDALKLAGSGEMRWFGLKLYDATLWAGPGHVPGQAPGGDHVLMLRYARAIAGRDLVEASLDEMRRLGERDERRLARWRLLLDAALPSVAPGETLVGLHQPGRGASFWHQGQLTAQLDDAELARAFFGIWLDPRTREPGLRARLLGLGGAPR